MSFLSAAHSDVGIKKNINQDSVLIKEAVTDCGNILLAAICDGMGGLAKGEVASAALIKAFSCWFEEKLPFMLYKEGTVQELVSDEIRKSWTELIDEVNQKIMTYSEGFHATCGTTLVAILMSCGRYYIINIGDSRVYHLNESFEQLTRDQTYVQREIDEGRMTVEEAKNHPQRNVLLQCVGASQQIFPDFLTGEYSENDVFLMCSDGFRHLISEDEFEKIMIPEKMNDEKAMQDALVYCTELNKQRKENDNISSILIKVNQGIG